MLWTTTERKGGDAVKEIKVEFQIDDKDYILFVEKKLWRYKVYLFQKLEGRIMEPVPVETVSVSTAKDVLEHWRILLVSHLRQKMKKKGGKSRGCNSRDCAR